MNEGLFELCFSVNNSLGKCLMGKELYKKKSPVFYPIAPQCNVFICFQLPTTVHP